MGLGAAVANGVDTSEVPVTIEESGKGLVEQIDTISTRHLNGGFVSYTGETLPW